MEARVFFFFLVLRKSQTQVIYFSLMSMFVIKNLDVCFMSLKRKNEYFQHHDLNLFEILF